VFAGLEYFDSCVGISAVQKINFKCRIDNLIEVEHPSTLCSKTQLVNLLLSLLLF